VANVHHPVTAPASATTPIAANSHRHCPGPASSPPIVAPNAEPPNSPTFISATVSGTRAPPWRVISGGSATTSTMPVTNPCRVRRR
jgi:hypothetical protein